MGDPLIAYKCTRCFWKGSYVESEPQMFPAPGSEFEHRKCPKCGELALAAFNDVPGSPANDPSPLRDLFTITQVPVTDARQLVPVIRVLLKRFDAIPEGMHPALDEKHNAHGAWDLNHYWNPFVKQVEVLRRVLKELGEKDDRKKD
jgi:hypothetical protein